MVNLLYKIRGQGYVLNLNISTQVEDLQKVLLFDYAAEILEKNGLIHPPDDERLRQLMERGQQGVTKSRSYIYEMIIAANYITYGFNVDMPREEGSVDIIAEEDEKIYIECKVLEPPYWNTFTAKLFKLMNRRRINAILTINVRKAPYSHREAELLSEKVLEAYENKTEFNEFTLQHISLPYITEKNVGFLIGDPYFYLSTFLMNKLGVIQNVDYMSMAADVGIFNGKIKIREPKAIIVRHINKIDELKKLKRKLREAKRKFKNVKIKHGANKLICIDLSELLHEVVRIGEEKTVRTRANEKNFK